LPGPRDDSDRPSTLPQAELNPLLNPVLARHMGRWAEVYFTSVPEKREEAVLQLLRELEEQEQDSSSASGSAPARRPESAALPQVSVPAQVSAPAMTGGEIPGDSTLGNATSGNRNSGDPTPDNPAQGESCFWCGHVNRREYKFCSRCGEAMATSFAANSLTAPRGENLKQKERGERLERQSYTDFLNDSFATDDRSQYDRPQHSQPSHDSEPQILPSFQPPRSESHGADEFSRSSPPDDVPLHLSEWEKPSLRPWFLAVLVIVVVATAYVTWRGTQMRPQASSTVAQPGPPHSFAEPATDLPPNRDGDTPAPPAKAAPGNAVSPNPAAATNELTSNAARTPAGNGSGAATPDKTVFDKGDQELAQARDFLDGRNGKQHNGEQAAEWLWRAVRKENVEATVLLSGLYLRGDGVPKNCDQAHLLLDAAAGKGSKEAAAMLRNLVAFGCQ
jgi:hypothetical protein